MKKLVFLILILPVLFVTGCVNPIKEEVTENTSVLESNSDKYSQTDKKIYKEPTEFRVDSKIDITKMQLSDEAVIGDDYLEKVLSYLPETTEEVSDIIDYSPVQDLNILATYKINGENIKKISGKLSAEQQEKLNYTYYIFKKIIPNYARKNLAKLEVYEKDSSAAYINNDEEDISKMVLGINIDEAVGPESDIVTRFDVANLFIHEFGHLFSTDNTEAKKGGSCIEPNGVTFDCYKENSYLNRFHKEFWSNVDKNFKDNGEKPDADLENFYLLNKNNFINSYAATNPYEDFAESFMNFVTEYTPLESNDVILKKIAFFYQYDKLVKLRAEILKNMLELIEE